MPVAEVQLRSSEIAVTRMNEVPSRVRSLHDLLARECRASDNASGLGKRARGRSRIERPKVRLPPADQELLHLTTLPIRAMILLKTFFSKDGSA
jgi:hypothetical protein